MRARKKPIEVMAIHYTHNVDLDEFLKLLRSNKDEPVRYDESDGTIYIQKERGEIALRKGNWVIYEENTDKCFWAIDHGIFLKTYNKVKGTMNSFVKRVYEVDCVEFKDLSRKSIIEVLDFCGMVVSPGDVGGFLTRDNLVSDILKEGYITVNTLEGPEKLFPAEILIRGVEGEYYPVKRENFDKVYEVLNV